MQWFGMGWERLGISESALCSIGEFAPWEMSGNLGILLEMVGDERISMDIFRDSGDLLGTSPTASGTRPKK